MAYVFSDTTYTQDGLIQECEDITGLGDAGISGDDTRLKSFTRKLNNALDRFHVIAFQSDSLWSFDDRSYADNDQTLPIATTNLVSGQADYLFDEELLAVTQVFIKDSAGVWKELSAQDDKNTPNIYIGATSGLPTRYELVGNSIVLDPIPNYNSTAGLKVTFKRTGRRFNYNDGALSIGIPSLFHEYLARYACQPYLEKHGKVSKEDNFRHIAIDEIAIARFISNRAKPKRVSLGIKNESNK
jgi:hypothetical protein